MTRQRPKTPRVEPILWTANGKRDFRTRNAAILAETNAYRRTTPTQGLHLFSHATGALPLSYEQVARKQVPAT